MDEQTSVDQTDEDKAAASKALAEDHSHGWQHGGGDSPEPGKDPNAPENAPSIAVTGTDEERFKLDQVGKPKPKTDITIEPDADAVKDTGEAKVKSTEVNVVPSVQGAVLPQRGKPIPNTEGRTATMDDGVVRKADDGSPATANTDNVVAHFQKPDPLTLSGRAWDVVAGGPADKAAKEAATDSGLQAEGEAKVPVDDPKRQVTASPASTQATVPVGSTPQPGGPGYPPQSGAAELTHDMGRARRQEPKSTTDGGTLGVPRSADEPPGVTFNDESGYVKPSRRTLAPRPYLAGSPDPRVSAPPTGTTRTPLPQKPVAVPSEDQENSHADIAAAHNAAQTQEGGPPQLQ